MQQQAPLGFTEAACDIPCVDVWPLTLVRRTAMLAYKELDRQGRIVLQYPVRMYQDRVEICYLSPVPHAWGLEALAAAEEKIKVQGEQQRLAV